MFVVQFVTWCLKSCLCSFVNPDAGACLQVAIDVVCEVQVACTLGAQPAPGVPVTAGRSSSVSDASGLYQIALPLPASGAATVTLSAGSAGGHYLRLGFIPE